MASVGLQELLEAGVHFGHQTRRWNPKMRRFIFGERGGIYIIDLLKTERLLETSREFASGIAHRGGDVLFVGTKKQARDAVKEVAEEAGMPYVNHRWLGGLLTNFQTISLRIKRLHDLERYEADGQLALLPTRERLSAEADLVKLRANLGGVKHMQRPPDALFVVDLKTEAIAVREAQRLRIPIIGLVDTNCDPDGIDYVIPGNDDAMKACRVITAAIGDVVQRGRQTFREEEERARQEAEAQARHEAEEKARREAEENARREAEAAAAEEALTHGGKGLPRQEAEQVVADAVAARGRPPVEGRRQAEAAAATADDELAAPTAIAGAPAGDASAEPPARRARQSARTAKAPAETAPAAPESGPSEIASEAAAEVPPAEPTVGAVTTETLAVEAPPVPPEPAAPPAEQAESEGTPEESADVAAGGEEGDEGVVDRAQAAAGAAAETAQEAASTVVETAQDAATTVVGTAQDVAASAAETAVDAVDAVADRAPGPLKRVAKAAAGAVEAAAEAVGADTDEGDEKTEESK